MPDYDGYDDEIAMYAKLLVSDAGDMLAGETIHISGSRGGVGHKVINL